MAGPLCCGSLNDCIFLLLGSMVFELATTGSQVHFVFGADFINQLKNSMIAFLAALCILTLSCYL